MNILFVYSLDDVCSEDKPLRSQEQINFGISYISAVLKKHGFNTRLIIVSKAFKDKSLEKMRRFIDHEFFPQLICFSSISTEYDFHSELASKLKPVYKEIFFLVGGPHPTLNPDEVCKDDFDALCVGEGEYPVLELARQLKEEKSPSGIPNLWIRKGNDFEKTEARPFIQDLDELPFADREIWQEWIEEPHSRPSVMLGRGCPYQCTYCSNHALKKVASGRYVRVRKPEKIVGEIKSLVEDYSVTESIYLEVETIGVNQAWALELCSEIQAYNATLDKPLTFGTNLRVSPNKDWDQLFDAFQKSNFSFVNIGLESGSERVRTEILKRRYSNQDIINAVNSARKHGLKVCFFNLVGIPGETPEDFEETIAINRICKPDWYFLSIFYPYPGTDLHRVCIEKGYVEKSLPGTLERTAASIDYPLFSSKEIQKNYIWFEYNVFKGIKPLHKILARVLVSSLKTNMVSITIYRSLMRLRFLKWVKSKLK